MNLTFYSPPTGKSSPLLLKILSVADEPLSFQLNAGSMVVRSRPSALAFLNIVRNYRDANQGLSEQDCIRDVINNNAHGEADQALWIPQWKMNAFPDEIKCWDKAGRGWERGMFLVHFAGAWAHLKEEDPTGFLMRKYEKEIIWSWELGSFDVLSLYGYLWIWLL